MDGITISLNIETNRKDMEVFHKVLDKRNIANMIIDNNAWERGGDNYEADVK